jgi:hypothetical protein
MSSLLELQSVTLVFSTSFVNYCPTNLLSGSPTPPLPNQSQSTVYTDSVWLGRGGGGGGCCVYVGDHILQELNAQFLTRFRNYKIALPPQTKPRRIGGSRTDKLLPQSPFTGQFFYITTFGMAFQSNNFTIMIFHM